jgi:LAGLIDADG-like domain
MATFRKPNTLSATEAAYIAGLIDGEGTITLGRKHRDDNRRLIVSISSTERILLEYVRSVCGVGKITGKRTCKACHAPGYTYTVTNRQALTLLEQTTHYLRTYKSDRCRLILANYLALTPRNGMYTPELMAEKARFETAVLSITPFRSTP